MATATILAWNNDPDEKTAHLREMKAHAKADELIKGSYSRQNGTFKGCAIGCGIYSLALRRGLKGVDYGNHALYSSLLGVPQEILRLEDHLFERLPDKESKTWPVRFLDAIPVGADLSSVVPQFFVLMLTRARKRIEIGSEDWRIQCLPAIDAVIEIMKSPRGDKSAYSVARAAYSAVARVARAAARAAYSAAYSAEIKHQTKDLIDLMRKAK